MSSYTQLHDNSMPEETEALTELWQTILNDDAHHIIVAEEGGRIRRAQNKRKDDRSKIL